MISFNQPAVTRAAQALAGRVSETPLIGGSPRYREREPDTRLTLKCEFLQRMGSFKVRGALLHVLSLDDDQRARGIVAVSAGNHAIACAYAARTVGISCTVSMLASANPKRVELCRSLGARIVNATGIHEAFESADRLVREEGRYLVHPFDAPLTVLGSATLGREIALAAGDADAVIVPTGGGGLLAGVAAGVHAWLPDCAVYGVEPDGARSMTRSFERGEPVTLDEVTTIADSLGAPRAMAYSYEICREHVAGMVTVSDAAIRAAMIRLFDDYGFALEPAPAAALAALAGPLRERLTGKHVVAVLCGSNIDWRTYASLMATTETPTNAA